MTGSQLTEIRTCYYNSNLNMKNKLQRSKNFCKQNWWIMTLLSIVVLAVVIVISGNQERILLFKELGELLNKLITPVCIMLGLILGYPLLKRRLLDGYISRQFEIMYNTNRKVRARCLKLREKYSPDMHSHRLEKKDLLEALEDMKKLNELSIDANDNVYKYSYLVYKTLSLYNEKTPEEINPTAQYRPYREGLHTWLHYHIMQIFRYSKSIGTIPHMDAEKKNILNDRLDKYVTDNTYFEIKNLDKSISYHHNSAQLVLFSMYNNAYIDDNDWILSECSYEAAPSPCPFARLMYNENIYIPPILSGEKIINAFETQLSLTGFKRKKSTNLSSGKESRYYICTYANSSDMGFVNTISGINDLVKYNDAYLKEEFNISGLTGFKKYSEMIRFHIPEEVAKQNYERVKTKLKDKLESEV